MTHPDPNAAGPAHAASDVPALPPCGWIANGADDGSDTENWVGYESLHPLTWVPVRGVQRSA